MTTLAALGTTVATRHLGRHPGLVDEQQPGRLKACLEPQPSLAATGYVRAVLFVGVQRFFLKLMPWRWKNRHTVPMPTDRPRLRS